jgi:hypothetical protein
MAASTAPAAPQLPTCIPTAYTDRAGRHCLAYPRSPWNAARYLVTRSGGAAEPHPTDLECVHDDFGRLVPMRERRLTADWTSQLAWRPVQQGAVA